MNVERTCSEPRLLTIKAAAQYLSVTVWFIRGLVYGKEVPALKLGNRWVIDKADLDAYVEKRKRS